MKKIASRLLAALLTVCLAVTLLVPAAVVECSAVSETKRFNIMMVIDGSGSLETADRTDPDRMRYELISDLLGILENNGHNIGAVVFSGNSGTGTSDADMAKGIMLNTGMLSLDSPSPDGRPVKDYVYEKVKSAGYDHTRNGTTDIGTALLTAERELQKAQKSNGLESLVFLFTDGVSYLKNVQQLEKSKTNMELATKEMHDNGIRLMGAFLNKDGKLDSSEITGIVCAANGITETSKEFLISYAEINNAASCHDAVNTILKFLGYIPLDDDPVIKYESFEDQFTIPGVGVEEMNIRLYSAKGETLPDIQVELVQPDGSVLKGTTLNAMCRRSRTFRIYKLEAPQIGDWTLRVTIPEGNKIGYIYSPIISMYVDAEIKTSPSVENLHANMDVTFTGLLSQNCTPITDATSYRGYNCTLTIKNLLDGNVDSYDIPNNGNGIFEHSLLWDKNGQYEAQITFHCGDIRVASPALPMHVDNTRPSTRGVVNVNVAYGLFQDDTATVDLTKYFDDKEDGKNLTVTVRHATCGDDVYSLKGTDLQLQSKKAHKSTIELLVQDSVGDTADLTLKIIAHNASLWFVILIVVLAIIITAVILLCKWKDSTIKAKGELNVSFEIEKNNRSILVPLSLNVPGTNAPNKTTLKKLMDKALNDDSIRLDCDAAPSEVKNALRRVWDDLDDVAVYKAFRKSRKNKEGAIGVKYGKKSKVLYDSAFTFVMDDIEFTVEFIIERDDEDIFSDDSFGPGNKPADDVFDDLFS